MGNLGVRKRKKSAFGVTKRKQKKASIEVPSATASAKYWSAVGGSWDTPFSVQERDESTPIVAVGVERVGSPAPADVGPAWEDFGPPLRAPQAAETSVRRRRKRA